MNFSQADSRPEGFGIGDWVAQLDCDPNRPRIAKIHDEYADHADKSQRLVDLIFYDHDGTRVGRASPACGGPRGFEPACPASRWTPIEKPDFPYLAKFSHSWGKHIKIRNFTDASVAIAVVGDDLID